MQNQEAHNQSFITGEAINNFAGFYNALLKVRTRLLSEDCTIADGKILRPTSNFKNVCYTPAKYDETQSEQPISDLCS